MSMRLVTLGGGKGQPELLRYLKEYDVEIAAIATTMDNGGSSGVLRAEYGIVSPGDVRRCISALSHRPDLDALWNYRFERGVIKNHTVGNIVLSAAMMQSDDAEEAIRAVATWCRVQGTVLPVTCQPTQLIAQLEDGSRIEGEERIDLPQHDAVLHIAALSLEPVVEATPAVQEALRSADVIVLTMGDLFTSVLPNLLVRGVTDAIAESRAPVIAICNRTTKQGETHDFSVLDFYNQISRYLAPASLHSMIVDDYSVAIPAGAQRVASAELPAGVRVVATDLADEEQPARVSGKKAAAVLYALCNSL